MANSKYWIFVLLLFAVAYGSSFAWRKRGEDATRAQAGDSAASHRVRPLVSLTLTDQRGQPFDFRSLSGEVWVASFFFTNCPGPCWQLNQTLAEMQRSGSHAGVKFVSITCDPDNDKPAALASYAKRLSADENRWVFLTGDLEDLKRLAHSFNLSLEKAIHSDRAFIVDRNGDVTNVRGFRLTQPDDVRRLKAELAELERQPTTASSTKSPARPL